ncbi:MAG: hypothetical protein HQ486_04160 [Acidimicrobiaceae bacterium]|nr:hypothetical protein [Acidimicrobiaceae bacterium]
MIDQHDHAVMMNAQPDPAVMMTVQHDRAVKVQEAIVRHEVLREVLIGIDQPVRAVTMLEVIVRPVRVAMMPVQHEVLIAIVRLAHLARAVMMPEVIDQRARVVMMIDLHVRVESIEMMHLIHVRRHNVNLTR